MGCEDCVESLSSSPLAAISSQRVMPESPAFGSRGRGVTIWASLFALPHIFISSPWLPCYR